jgi:hypothetical protein
MTDDHITIFLSAAVALGTMLQFGALTVIIMTTRRQLRAYVFVEAHPDDQPTFDANIEIRVPLHLHNRGQTPAYRVSQWIECRILPHPLVREPPTPEIPTPFTFIDLGPTAEFSIFAHLERGLTDLEKEGLTAGTMGVYIYGEIRYGDAFTFWRSKRHPRFTKFRYLILAGRDGRVRGILACPEGNYAN